MADLVVEAMFEHWGPRCDEFHPDCEGCRAWAQFDALEAEASKGERLQAALTTALALIDDYLAYRHDGDPWSELALPETRRRATDPVGG